jgi:phosphate transport system permease protein|tara:strand:+ start:97344 stop:98726 length:1383 start_codon:yes stop_codon:yes gene_type:complete
MELTSLLSALIVVGAVAYYLGLKKSRAIAGNSGGIGSLHSLPGYYGTMVALWCLLPALFLLAIWQFSETDVLQQITLESMQASELPESEVQRGLLINTIENISTGRLESDNPAQLEAAEYLNELRESSQTWRNILVLGIGLIGSLLALMQVRAAKRARNHVEGIFRIALIFCSLVAIITTLGIVLSVLFEATRFFQTVPFFDFVFGLQWSPQTAIRADQVGASGSFGAIPLFLGTLQISFMAMCVAVPIGLFSAIYLSEYAGPRLRNTAKPLLEILAGIPTVVYGFFAALTVAPAIREWGQSMGLATSSESALAAGAVMGIMIIPFVSSLSDDVINAVPQSLRDGSYGLGATKSETIVRVVIPAALPGIVGGVLLAVSRAIGETMIVVMAAGLAANLTMNPLESVTTVTVQIVTLLVGDQEFDSPKTLAAFALGLMLFLVTLVLNAIALWVVNRYREQYE